MGTVRRIVVVWLTVSVVTALLGAAVQGAPRAPRIGFLTLTALASSEMQATLEAFRQGLRDHGYVEGQNLLIEYRAADGRVDLLRGLATDLAALRVDAIVAVATPAARAARQATSSIPIVAIAMGDPVGDGLVASLARPGANLTGTTFLGPQLVPKHLELVKETLPRATRVAILWHPGAFAEATTGGMRTEVDAAGRRLGLRMRFVHVEARADVDRALSIMTKDRPDALVVGPSPMLFAERRRIAEFATRQRLPSFFNSRQAVELGGLIGYGTSLPVLVRRSVAYVDKIVRGARPGDLPVEQPTTFELTVNVKTARALGLSLAPSLLARADATIE
jgi:putative ABC transport system substrate-binding protein